MSEIAVAAMSKAQARIYAAIHEAETELRALDPRYSLNVEIGPERLLLCGGASQVNVSLSATLANRSLRHD